MTEDWNTKKDKEHMTEVTKNYPDPTYLLEEGITINGKWKILNFIAKGGKGEVYLAHSCV
jgi:hypothetical protein